MELELGVKLTRAADDCVSEFQIAKDRAGPVFLSRETDTMFILTAHLKGYTRANIKIDINEDGTIIAISGEKRVQETVMVGWKLHKKDTEIKGFKKVFKIPDGVILDKIKARFNEVESTLTISMPKKMKGIRGTFIEEVHEKDQLIREGSGNFQIADEKISRTDLNLIQEKDQRAEPCPETENVVDSRDVGKGPSEIKRSPSVPDVGTDMPEQGPENRIALDDIRENTEPEPDQEIQGPDSKDGHHEHRDHQVLDKIDENHEDEKREEAKGGTLILNPNGEARENEDGKVLKEESSPREKRCNLLCTPVVASSALLLSLVVFVIHMIRNKNQISRRRD